MSNVAVARSVAEYLKHIGEKNVNDMTFVDVKPVEVMLGRQVYYGAQYGIQRADGSVQKRFYLVGDLPQIYKQRKSSCFRFDGQDRDWYVAGFYNEAWLRKNKYPIQSNPSEFHPFGDYVMLGEWDSPDGRSIDDGERFEYKRHPITVQML